MTQGVPNDAFEATPGEQSSTLPVIQIPIQRDAQTDAVRLVEDRLVHICFEMESDSRDLLAIMTRSKHLSIRLGAKMGADYQPHLENHDIFLADLADLIFKTQITGFVMMTNDYSLEYLKQRAAEGIILNVFSEAGLAELIARIRRAIIFLEKMRAMEFEYLESAEGD